MPAIRHLLERWIPGEPARVRAALDDTWTGGAKDAFPSDHIRPWRRPAAAADASRMTPGTRFGHGPFAFVVDHADEHGLRVRITTPGYDGWHAFVLRADTRDGIAGTHISHELVANMPWAQWAAWTAVTGDLHDWAVEATLLRLEQIATTGRAEPSPTPPWQLRAFERAHRAHRALIRRQAAPSPGR